MWECVCGIYNLSTILWALQLNFSPVEEGFYEAVLELFSFLVTDPSGNDHTPIASVRVIAQAEKPRIQVMLIKCQDFMMVDVRLQRSFRHIYVCGNFQTM